MRCSNVKNTQFFLLLILLFSIVSCGDKKTQNELHKTAEINAKTTSDNMSVSNSLGDIEISNPADYSSLLKDKRIAIVANQTSVVENKNGGFVHLVDTLFRMNFDIKKVFSPEHGFRGTADAGEHIDDGVDAATGLPLISLYGAHKKPSPEQLSDVDIVIFDIQDVGVRFYTYISTLHYVMEACAEAKIPLIVIDRPNPNAHYIDGPMLEKEHRSFVGMHPVPLVYGMTIGEYAAMINGEGWLDNGVTCELNVMPLKHYTHQTPYSLPIKPSPNLPNDLAINLYPSLGFFEGTLVSAGRGTAKQFQLFGAPFLPKEHYPYEFTPQSNPGAKFPKFKGELCHGIDLSDHPRLEEVNLKWLIEAYKHSADKDKYFNTFLTKLAGTTTLRTQIEAGWSADKIRNSWRPEIDKFKQLREQYLRYTE